MREEVNDVTDKEILTALSGMLEPIKQDISELKEDVSELKKDVSGLKGDVSSLKEDMSEVKERLKKVELRQEIDIIPRLQTIESCYTSTYERYKQSVEGYEEMRQDISVIMQVVTGHSAKLWYIPALPMPKRRKKLNAS